jgi:hypothetical protein
LKSYGFFKLEVLLNQMGIPAVRKKAATRLQILLSVRRGLQ